MNKLSQFIAVSFITLTGLGAASAAMLFLREIPLDKACDESIIEEVGRMTGRRPMGAKAYETFTRKIKFRVRVYADRDWNYKYYRVLEGDLTFDQNGQCKASGIVSMKRTYEWNSGY